MVFVETDFGNKMSVQPQTKTEKSNLTLQIMGKHNLWYLLSSEIFVYSQFTVYM